MGPSEVKIAILAGILKVAIYAGAAYLAFILVRGTYRWLGSLGRVPARRSTRSGTSRQNSADDIRLFGYHIDYISPAIVQGDDLFKSCFLYTDGQGEIFFDSLEAGHPSGGTIDFPYSDDEWDRKYSARSGQRNIVRRRLIEFADRGGYHPHVVRLLKARSGAWWARKPNRPPTSESPPIATERVQKPFDIARSRHSELSAEKKQQLEAAANAEFGQFAIVRETQWATPDWTFQAIEGAELAAFYNIVERTVQIDGVPVRVAGLNNLVTLPTHRGRGVASRLLLDTQPQWFDSLGAECGVLLCADALLAFYSRLGWEKADVRVTYTQPGGSRAWAANCMLLDPFRRLAAIREIDLCGLPW